MKRRENDSSVNDKGGKYLKRQDNIVLDDKIKKRNSENLEDRLYFGTT